MTHLGGGLYIVLISIHGLIRGNALELGRDADTGGQTKYVVELARALGCHPAVSRVDLLTRLIVDPAVSNDYSVPVETLAPGVDLVRIPCGPERYLPKEQLWDTLDNFADSVHDYLSHQTQWPTLIHAHYADAGYVGSLLARRLSVPFVFTGHSLGHSKRNRLIASGVNSVEIERLYNMSRRIEAEENVLSTVDCIITSTHQEIEEQYECYDCYRPEHMHVVPPGTDMEKFYPPDGSEASSEIALTLRRFLTQAEKPMILAISRPDRRKNINSLLIAYGEDAELQALANLVIIAGNRDDLREMDDGSQCVLNDILYYIDLYDLYGKVAYPKHHCAEDVSVLYRLAALQKGVFVNPALTEPFGLTLIEAAASGLPIIATEDGGPRDIVANCQNGYLVDPLDIPVIAERIRFVLSNDAIRDQQAQAGLIGVRRHYSWRAHVERYIEVVMPVIQGFEPVNRISLPRRGRLYRDRSLFSDFDQTLIGDEKSLFALITALKKNSKCCNFGIATGRRLDSALKLIRHHQLPMPDVLISSSGTEIYYGHQFTRDTGWQDYIDFHWRPNKLRQLLKTMPGLKLQPKTEQSQFKLSFFYDPTVAASAEEIHHYLLKNDVTVNCVLSFGQYLDILPIRASKGLALRWYAQQWGVSLEHILVAGGTGSDEGMLRGNTLGVVVANPHGEELGALTDCEGVYFSRRPYAAGILEAIEHYDFFAGSEDIRV
jgi:sucrose-phosphate synthase